MVPDKVSDKPGTLTYLNFSYLSKDYATFPLLVIFFKWRGQLIYQKIVKNSSTNLAQGMFTFLLADEQLNNQS